MQTRQSQKKQRKNKKINRKNISLVLLYLRISKILKIIFNILIISLFIYFIILLYQNNITQKVKIYFISSYTKLFYKNICMNVEINGIEKSDIIKIKKDILNFCNLNNKNNMKHLLNQISKDPWIKNITLKRKLPNSLEIKIEEYSPFAIWKNNEKLHLIDESGKIIQINENQKKIYYNLLIVAGEGSKENIHSLFNLLSSNPNLFSKIKIAERVGERRWNFELNNDILVKMPEKNIIEAWNRLDKLLSIRGAEIDLKVIDLRNEDKIFLEEIY